MSARTGSGGEFEGLRIEGGLFAPEWLSRVAAFKARQQTPPDYDVPRGLLLRDEISRYWRIAQGCWADFEAGCESADKIAVASRFAHDLLIKVFGFPPLAKDVSHEIAGRTYSLTYEGKDGRVPVVIGPGDQSLDTPHPRHGDGGRRRSAFGLLQEYLNAAEQALWGLACNGVSLRLARDNASLTRPAWLEADLERIFSEDRFADFSVLWLFIHASRFGAEGTRDNDMPLEVWRNEGQEEGSRAREALRLGVEQALRELGQGFLANPRNSTLSRRLEGGELVTAQFFNQLLRLVYRLIFLLTVEERGLLHPPGSGTDAIDLYAEGYSLKRLRDRCLRRSQYDRHPDLWNALKPVFAGLGRGEPRLALPPLGGLFARDQCPDLDSCEMENQALLSAVYHLTWMRRDGTLTRVNWKDMGPEELGSVYESLLELTPLILDNGRRFNFAEHAEARGHERKLTGSYYTPDPLVQQLLDTALEPVVQQRIAANPDNAEQAILEISVIDPACGSGHFLLAAARRLAGHLARLRAGGTPSDEDYRHALRDIVTHCIYGIDRNAVTLELARVALWLEAFTPDKPLGFLDHHLICGDALLGLLDLEIVYVGIPDDAYKALTGDDPEVCRELRNRNRGARRTLERTVREPTLDFQTSELGRAFAELDAADDANLDELAAKEHRFEALHNRASAGPLAMAADMYLAAFLLSKTTDTRSSIPTTAELVHLLHGNGRVEQNIATATREVCHDAQVLHWPLAFPQVFARGGFDVVIGNPPWERIKLQEQEFFAARAPAVAQARNRAERQREIRILEQAPPGTPERAIFDEFISAKHLAEAISKFVHVEARFPLTGVGDVNTYALFAETALGVIGELGFAGVVLPTGIATDDSTKSYFERISQKGRLVSLLAFENEEFIFPAVHHSTRFCLLTIRGKDHGDSPAILTFFARQPMHIKDERRHFSLTPEEFRLINPNTRTCPVFRSGKDAELAKKIYRNVSVLIDETKPAQEGNPWGISFQAMFHMANDSGLFSYEPDIENLPLYEAKMIHQFDHRWATYRMTEHGELESVDVSDEQKSDPAFAVTPRYWVNAREVWLRTARLPQGMLKAIRDGNEETMVLCLVHWLFGQWLIRNGIREPVDALGEVILHWREFIHEFQFARDLAPTQLGLCGNNPPCLHPQGMDYLPAEPVSDVVDDQNEVTAWYQADPVSVTAFLQSAQEFTIDLEIPTAIDSINEAVEFTVKLLEAATPKWFMGWRDITSAHVLRTVIASVVPKTGTGDTLLLIFIPKELNSKIACLLAEQNSLVHDYVARQKVGGTHLKYHVKKQLPNLPPSQYNQKDEDFIVPRVLELTYTSNELKDWACELGYQGPPFSWDPEHRALLRAELDAYYARLYGLDRDDLRYILDPADVMGEDYPTETFRVLKNNEQRQYGEYRTRRLVLEAWDRLFG